MKIRTSELIGAALDWAVARCEGWEFHPMELRYLNTGKTKWNYSTDWSQGGPIIEREKIELIPPKDDSDPDWMAVWLNSDDVEAGIQNGPTPLVAAMRCYVASKMGDEVEIPDELV